MGKQLLLTLLLAGGMFLGGTASAWAEPQSAEETGQSASVLSGTVLDENGEPAVGASVVVKNNTKVGASADIEGKFSLRVNPGTTLRVSYVGYKTVDVAAQAGMSVKLERNDAYLDEVVVVGYGTQKKVNLTGAVSTVDVEKTLEGRPQQDLAKALQGAVPGLTITTTNGTIDGTAKMRIRGTGTLSNSATSDPLIVVDGVPMDDISFLDPNDIQDISVLKDAASSSIYGTRAAFGVILITTKSAKKGDRFTIKYTNNFSWSGATKLPQYASAPDQMKATLQAAARGGDQEIFGIYIKDMLPYAEAWEEQNNYKKSGYREMRQFQSWDDVGDYYIDDSGNVMYYADWDVSGIMFNNAAPSNTHNVSIDGSTGRASYHAAFGYNKREGLVQVRPDKLHRYNANANFQVDLTDWLTAGVRVNFTDKEYDSCNSDRNPFQYTYRWSSYFEPLGYMLDADGNPVDCLNDIAFLKAAGDDLTVTTNTRVQGWLRAEIIKGLSIQADFTYSNTNTNNNYNRQPVYSWYTWQNTMPSAPSYYSTTTHATEWHSTDNVWTTNVYGTYDHTFNNDHNLKVMIGFNAEQETYDYFWARRMSLIDTSMPVINLATGDQTVSQSSSHRATAGFFGRINYDYKGIYLAEVNGRYDGSSKFPASDQWAFFPSFSLGYRFSEEKYFDNLRDVWNNGKLRFSYGEIGNEAVGSNRFISTISSATSYWLDSSGVKVSMFDMPSTVSESLSWERVKTMDLGLDLGFFNNELTFSGDIYQRDTNDMLAPSGDLPASVGTDAPYTNSGKLRTRGWEFAINWNKKFGDWNVYANFSLSDAKTVIKEWYSESGLISSYYSGQVYGDIYGFVTDRYFELDDFNYHYEDIYDSDGAVTGQKIVIDNLKDGIPSQSQLETGNFKYGPGDIKFKDLNGDGVISSGKGTYDDMGDVTVIGNNQPRYEYSFRLGATWKGFDLDLYFQGVGRRQMWTVGSFIIPMAQADVSYYGGQSYNQVIVDNYSNLNIIGYEVDQSNFYPCMYAGAFTTTSNVPGLDYGVYNFYPQTKYLQDMSYLRLKTLTFGYTIPADITRKFFVQNLRVYFTGENLFFLHDGSKDYPIDPELAQGSTTSSSNYNGLATWGRTYPMMRSYSFGFQLTF